MGQVIEIHQKRFFTIEEASALLPVVKRITKKAFDEVKKLTGQLAFAQDRELRLQLEKRIQEFFEEWHSKVTRLGCEAKGMWLVDFDSGEGHYCWQYPEQNIEFFHGYLEGFQGRVRIH